MKKLLIVAILLAGTCNIFAQTTDKKKDTKIYLSKDKSCYFDGGIFSVGINFGLNMPEKMDKANISSEYVMWDVFNVTKELGDKHDKLSLGFGMIWNKYASTNGMFTKEDGKIVTGKYATLNSDYSRYLTYALSIPVQYTHTCKNGMYYSFGTAVNFNVYSSIYNEWDEGNTISTMTNKKAYHNPVTMDLRAQFGYKGIGLMVKYSPMNVIKKDRGPEFQSLGIGVTVNTLAWDKKNKK